MVALVAGRLLRIGARLGERDASSVTGSRLVVVVAWCRVSFIFDRSGVDGVIIRIPPERQILLLAQ